MNKIEKREYNKIYFQKHKKEIVKKRKEYLKKYYKNNKKRIQRYKKKYRQENRQKLALKRHQDYIKNKENILEHNKRYLKKYRQNNANYRLRCILRKRVYSALKHKSKFNSTLKLLGCSINKLKRHLEKQFQKGMSWNNYGKYGWHIDHIKPCYSFDLSQPIQQKKCFHYSNLRPLWADENLKRPRK